jgi:eukaryotic-like serine/threonine-protein kinase
MSPEQAKGKPVDRRSDIYAFGLVLYEMVTGKRLHQGETTTEVLASVIKEEPNWERVPVEVRKLLRRCLEKDPQKRLKHIGDVMQLVDKETETAPSHSRLSWGAWSAAGLAILVAAALAFVHFREKAPAPPESMRFEIAQPPNVTFEDPLALSPDGRKLAFIAIGSGAAPQIWVRSLDAADARPLAGTESPVGFLFWSPDSRYIVFAASGKLQKVESTGGPAQTLCSVNGPVIGGFWTREGKIVFGNDSGLFQVGEAGGSPSPLTIPTAGEFDVFPTLLPDGRHFLYGRDVGGEMRGVYLGSLDAKPDQQAAKKLLPDPSPIAYVPSADPAATTNGYVFFVRSGTLMAQPFDNRRLDVAGEAVPIAERLSSLVAFSISANGVLAFRAGSSGPGGQLTWFDRKGASPGAAGDPSVFPINSPLALSPDGKRVAFARTDPESRNTDIWLYDFGRGVLSRFTFDPGRDENPVWSPDGSRIAFAGQRGGSWGIYQKASNLAGGEELLYKSPNSLIPRPSSWSHDGRFLLFSGGISSVWVLPLQTSDPQPQRLVRSEFLERDARLSPDGRYFAYVSNSSGKEEIYVRPFDASSSGTGAVGGTSMVSKDGGGAVRWRGDGKEIFYLVPGGDLMSVEVSTKPVFQAGVPKPLFKPPATPNLNWDVTADGKRFLFAVPVGQNSAAPYTVVLNWQAALRR